MPKLTDAVAVPLHTLLQEAGIFVNPVMDTTGLLAIVATEDCEQPPALVTVSV